MAKRQQAIEIVRVLAIFGVVAFHASAPFSQVAYGGLIFFVILSPYVDLRYNWSRLRETKVIAITFLLPWLFWMAVFGVKNIVLHRPIFPYGFTPLGVLAGTSVHLWFLPAMFIVLVAINQIKQMLQPLTLFWISVGSSALLLLSITFWINAIDASDPPIRQWLHALPAVFAGIAFGLRSRVNPPLVVVATITLVIFFVLAWVDIPSVSTPYIVGISAMIVISYLSLNIPFNIQPIASCTFGIYVTHVVWLSAFTAIIGGGNYLTVSLTFVVSLATVYLFRRHFPLSRLVLG